MASCHIGACIVRFTFALQVVYGFGEGLAVRIGYHLGKSNVAAAKRVVILTAFFNAVWAAIFCMAVLIGRNHVGQLFSDDPEVIALTTTLVPWFSGSYFAYAVFSEWGGIAWKHWGNAAFFTPYISASAVVSPPRCAVQSNSRTRWTGKAARLSTQSSHSSGVGW